MSENTKVKPVAKLTGADGNVFGLIGIAVKALRRAEMYDEAKEMTERISTCGSYNDALIIIGEYCEIT